MESNKSLDKFQLIAALVRDAHLRFGSVFNTKALRLTTNVMKRRYLKEGTGFLTKTLPRLCKHLDQALTGTIKLNSISVGFASERGSELPRFLGEFFSKIFQKDGSVLPDPDASCVKVVREILLVFYKYELPYTVDQEHEVVQSFIKAEEDLANLDTLFAEMRDRYPEWCKERLQRRRLWRDLNDHPVSPESWRFQTLRKARRVLNELFSSFDPKDIQPRHGPGVVATKQRLWEKFQWKNVSSRITQSYPFDAYFCASLGHVADTYDTFSSVTEEDLPARVLLVPKDSRGPRLISCEPVDFQWVQQGLGKAIVSHVERHPISRWNVFFTDQGPNQRGALLGSKHGLGRGRWSYSTLDLKEASDRVHLDLVRLLFPTDLTPYLESCRSSSTVLPDGKVLGLRKYAPMGSALCFPIMALTIWSILTAAAPNADTRESIAVYGDDVIVPTAYAESAMAILELFGLKINRNKSCTQGLFKESCGVDAFKGVNVTPVRLRTVWDESPRPDVYTSWIAYANSFYDRQCYTTYEFIVSRLIAVYGDIPGDEFSVRRNSPLDGQPVRAFPSLRETPAECSKPKRRFNKSLQRLEYKVRVVTSPSVYHTIDGWSMLLRYFSEAGTNPRSFTDNHSGNRQSSFEPGVAFSVSRYTKRRTSVLVRRWR